MPRNRAARRATEKPETIEEIEVLRPARARLAAGEALKRLKAFPGQRKERFVAAIRKGES